MNKNKFRVGQMVVIVSAARKNTFGLVPKYKVLQLLSYDGKQYAYRIKTITEAADRVVLESEIELPSQVCLMFHS